MIVDITGNQGLFRLTMIGNCRGLFPLILKQWTQTDYGIRITLRITFALPRRLQYQILIAKPFFNQMKVFYANFDEEEIVIGLETGDVEKCDKLDKLIGHRIGCLKVVNVM